MEQLVNITFAAPANVVGLAASSLSQIWCCRSPAPPYAGYHVENFDGYRAREVVSQLSAGAPGFD